MAKKVSIEVEKRDGLGTHASRRLRRQGKVAGVIYGYGKSAMPITLSQQVVAELLHHPGLVAIKVVGDETAYTAIVKDEQIDAITGMVLHLDLQEVRADEVIHAMVTIIAHGDPVGLHHGGELQHILREVEVKCLPGDMVESLVVEVSGLDLDQSIHVKDLALPPGLTAVTDPEQMVFQVRIPRRVEEEVPAEEAAVVEGAGTEPELVGRKKKEGEEGEEGEEAGGKAEKGEKAGAKPEKGDKAAGKPEKAEKKEAKKEGKK